VHELHHEVFPVNVDAAPEIGKAGRQVIQVVGFGQAKAEQVQHAADQVELTRDTEVQSKCREQKLHQVTQAAQFHRVAAQEHVHVAVENQLDQAANYPLDSGFIDRICIA